MQEAILNLVNRNIDFNLFDQDSIIIFLRSWWSKTYNRPLKDPLLDSYNEFELLYEFFNKTQRKKREQEAIEQENDRIEDDKIQQALDWADEQERKELEATNNSSDENNEAWMIKQLKKEYGDNFGDNIDIDF